MQPTPKPPLFSSKYKIFALILVLAIISAIALPKARQWLSSATDLAQNEQQS